MKFKKVLYSAGAIGALVTPTVSIVACSKAEKKSSIKTNKNDVIVNSITEKNVNSKLTVNGAQEASKFSKPKTILTDSGVLATLTWGKVNNDLGTIMWKAVLSKGNAKKKNISGTLKGFKTKTNSKNDVLKMPVLSLSELVKSATSEIDKINVPAVDSAAHSSSKHALIAGAKTTAKQDIASAKTTDQVTSKLAAQKVLIKQAIDDYNRSNGTNKALSDAKSAAVSEIDAIDVPVVDSAAHSATKYALIAGAKTTAKQDIASATTTDQVTLKLAAQKVLIKQVIDDYNRSTGTIKALSDAKSAAVSEIDAIDVPVVDSAAHSASKHALIAGAKTTAKQDIASATTTDQVTSKLAAQKVLIKQVIDDYNRSNGTNKILSDAKSAAVSEIDAIDVPVVDSAAHSATKYALIAGAKTTAKQDIASATTTDQVTSKLAAQKVLIKQVIDDYNRSTGTIKALSDAKSAAVSEIDAIDVPAVDSAAHSASKHALIAGAKTTAKQDIASATTTDQVTSKLAAQKVLIKQVIDDYNRSNGTNKILSDAKSAAVSEIDAIDVPVVDSAAHSATKYALIAGAKTTAKQDIASATTTDQVTSKLAAQKVLIKQVIDDYNRSTGTIKALSDAKSAAVSEIDAIDVPVVDSAAHSATKYALIAGAKTTAKQDIASATTTDQVTLKLAAQKVLIKQVIDDYNRSTGTIKALSDAKSAAVSEIDAIDVPVVDSAAHSATKYALIAGAKTTAKQDIASATTTDQVTSKLAAQKVLIKQVIDDYNRSTGTNKILSDAKISPIREIKTISIPSKEDSKHETSLYDKIEKAKVAALQKINDLTYDQISDINDTLNAEKVKIDAAINEYKNSQPIVTYTREKITNELNALKNQSNIFLYLLDLSGTTGKDGIASIQNDLSELEKGELANINLSVSIVSGTNGKLRNNDVLKLSATPKKWYVFEGDKSPISVDIQISNLSSQSASIIDEKALINYIKSSTYDKWGSGDLTSGEGTLYSTFVTVYNEKIKTDFGAILKSKTIIKGVNRKLKIGDIIRIEVGYLGGKRFRTSGDANIFVDVELKY